MDPKTRQTKNPAAAGGRLPASVYYQRRRAAAAVILVIVALLLVWILSSLGGGNQEDNSAQVAETSSAPAPTPSQSADNKPEAPAGNPEAPAPAAAPSQEQPAPATSEQQPKDSCELADLIVSASTDQPNYPSDVLPTFYMTVKNPTAADCVIDLSKDIPRFEVYNLENNYRIWADVDCNPSVETTTKTIAPGEEYNLDAKWSRTTSAEGQCDAREAVPAGSYYLHTVIGDRHSDAVTFNLA